MLISSKTLSQTHWDIMLSLSILETTIKQPSQEFSLVVGVLYLIKRESSNTTFSYGLDMSNYSSVKKRTVL